MKIPQSVLNTLRTAAIKFPTQECCGILANNFQLFPIRNVSSKPAGNFLFDKTQYVNTLNELKAKNLSVLAIYHTHPSGTAAPSKADLEYVEASRTDALIVSKEEWKWVSYAVN